MQVQFNPVVISAERHSEKNHNPFALSARTNPQQDTPECLIFAQNFCFRQTRKKAITHCHRTVVNFFGRVIECAFYHWQIDRLLFFVQSCEDICFAYTALSLKSCIANTTWSFYLACLRLSSILLHSGGSCECWSCNVDEIIRSVSRCFLNVCDQDWLNYSGQRIVARLREQTYSASLRQEIEFIERGEGDVLSRLSVDTSIVGERLLPFLFLEWYFTIPCKQCHSKPLRWSSSRCNVYCWMWVP